MKQIFIFLLLFICSHTVSADTFRWMYDLTFDAPIDGKISYNSRDRLEMVWHDMVLVIQVYDNRGLNDQRLKQNLQHRAASYNMYDTRTTRYEKNSFKGFCLEGTLPDGSRANIYNMVSKKTGICVQVVVNFTAYSRNDAKRLIKSFKQATEKKQKPKKRKPIKQKVQKKGTPPKPIKKPSTSPDKIFEI